MTSDSPLRQVELELYEGARDYAARASRLSADSYFREAVMKTAVSNFVWALYHAFDENDGSLEVLRDELIEQQAAVARSIAASNVSGSNAQH